MISKLKTWIQQKQARDLLLILLACIPIIIMFWVWLSPLAFVPVPWPDDSAFYFVAKELFKWPPRWVMLPQAPFEPTYRIFNFNTMPLYPILIGLGRFVGIDGSFLLKIWPLSAWALSGSLLVVALFRARLPFLFALLVALAFSLDPELRWASVLVRPESLIGCFGMAMVLGLTLGFPEKLKPRKFWDPIAALLALAAYAHFNAVHLLFPVIFSWASASLALSTKRLIHIGLKTALYLSPWILTVFWHWDLFVKQMTLQWSRLDVPNPWLSSTATAMWGLFQNLGSPTRWDPHIYYAAMGMWALILLIPGLIPGFEFLNKLKDRGNPHPSCSLSLLPAVGWVVGALWIWTSKPEVWFMYYLHIATWCLVGLGALKLWQSQGPLRVPVGVGLIGLLTFITGIFAYVDIQQARQLGATQSWNWPAYTSWIDCVDQRLTQLDKNLGHKRPFQVWDPTAPDITVELSRRHPDWEFTRTNDFLTRSDLAIQHGWETSAVVVTETFNWSELTVSDKAERFPELQSVWMRWQGYFLNTLWKSPGWKPNRFICQRGRWQAFLFMVSD